MTTPSRSNGRAQTKCLAQVGRCPWCVSSVENRVVTPEGATFDIVFTCPVSKDQARMCWEMKRAETLNVSNREG